LLQLHPPPHNIIRGSAYFALGMYHICDHRKYFLIVFGVMLMLWETAVFRWDWGLHWRRRAVGGVASLDDLCCMFVACCFGIEFIHCMI